MSVPTQDRHDGPQSDPVDEALREGRLGDLLPLLDGTDGSPEARLLRAEAAHELGLPDRARGEVDRARQALLARKPSAKLVEAYLWLARIEAAYDDPSLARVPIEKARQILVTGAIESDGFLGACVRAEHAVAAREESAAALVQSLREAVAGHPARLARAICLQGVLALASGDLDGGRRAGSEILGLPEAIRSAPDLAWRASALTGARDEGISILRRLLASLPPGLRAGFLRRRDRAPLALLLGLLSPAERAARDLRRLSRLVHDLAEQREVEALLRIAADAAIECTGAEQALLVAGDAAVRRGGGGRELPAGEVPRVARGVASGGPSACVDEPASLLAVPLRAGGRAIGVLVVESSTRAWAFGAEDCESAEAIADAAGTAVDAAFARPPAPPTPTAPPSTADDALLARLGRDALDLLADVVPKGEDLQAALAPCLRAALRVVGGERGFALLFEGKDRLSVHSAFRLREEEFTPDRFRLSFGVIARLVQKGKPIRVSRASEEAAFAEFQSVRTLGLESFVAVPIPGESGPIGVLYVDSTVADKSFSADDETLLVRLAALLGRSLREAIASHRRAIEVVDLRRALEAGMKDLRAQYTFDALLGESAPIRQIRVLLDHIVRFPYPVLVTGETGTGKEVVAKAIHANSPRKDHPIVSVNCAALPRELLESELFGHVKGAFTGADRERAGLFRAAHLGTLFLDEIGETSEELQRKLLRVLQEGEFSPVGSLAPQRCDVRIVAATNRDLDEEVRKGRFREDLYFRLKVFRVHLPPLRERVEDVPVLARHLLEKAVRETGSSPRRLGREAVDAMQRYPWPGNVRELENALRHGVAFSQDEIGAEHLPPEVRDGLHGQLARKVVDLIQVGGETPSRATGGSDDLWKALIEKTLAQVGGNRSEAAKVLGISRSTLHKRMRLYGIGRD